VSAAPAPKAASPATNRAFVRACLSHIEVSARWYSSREGRETTSALPEGRRRASTLKTKPPRVLSVSTLIILWPSFTKNSWSDIGLSPEVFASVPVPE